MLELAGLGAKVMQSPLSGIRQKVRRHFEVRSSLNDNPGTIVKEETLSMEDVVIRGVVARQEPGQDHIGGGAGPAPAWPPTFSRPSPRASVNVDMIVQKHQPQRRPLRPPTFPSRVDKPDLLKAKKDY